MKKLLLLVLSLFSSLACAQEHSNKLLKAYEEYIRYDYLSDLNLLKEGESYVCVYGGFEGKFYEFVDMKNQNRSSIMVGHPVEGEKHYIKKMFHPFREVYSDIRINQLRLAIKEVASKKYLAEIRQLSGDDSVVILVAVKSAGKLSYWARELFAGNVIEEEFRKVMELAKNTETLVSDTSQTRVTPPMPGK